jgi:hypothetical protein
MSVYHGPDGQPAAATTSLRLLVLTHHKCASSFIHFYLRRFCEINALRLYVSHLGSARPPSPLQYDVCLLTNACYARLAEYISVPAIHVIRNPLDVVVSAYYSHRATHPLDGWPELEAQRRVLQLYCKEAGFYLTLAFVERDDFYRETPGPLCALRHWRLEDATIRTIRMEDLVNDVTAVLGAPLSASFGEQIQLPGAADFTFERVSGGRSIGQIDNTSHYRSGLSGIWRRELPDSIVNYVREHFRSILERYYPDALA